MEHGTPANIKDSEYGILLEPVPLNQHLMINSDENQQVIKKVNVESVTGFCDGVIMSVKNNNSKRHTLHYPRSVPTMWPVSYPCAQPHHPAAAALDSGSGSHDQLFRPWWAYLSGKSGTCKVPCSLPIAEKEGRKHHFKTQLHTTQVVYVAVGWGPPEHSFHGTCVVCSWRLKGVLSTRPNRKGRLTRGD